jgi:hypothetical protein
MNQAAFSHPTRWYVDALVMYRPLEDDRQQR